MFLTILISMFGALELRAAPNSLTYQGRILKSDGTPLEYNNVSFLFEITNPAGTCVIYREQKNAVNLVNSGGVFDVPIGTGTKLFPTSPTITLLSVFDNTTNLDCGDANNNVASTYTPAQGHSRILRVQFYDGTGWKIISPDSEIRSVPYSAFAQSAQTLGTKTADDFVLKTGVPTCTPGSFLSYDGSVLSCAAVTGASGGTVTNVTSNNSYLTIINNTSTPTLTLNVGTTANTVAAGNDSRLTNAIQSGAAASGDLSGTYPNPTVAKIQSVSVSSASPVNGHFFKYNGTNWSDSAIAMSDVTGLNTQLGTYVTQSFFNTAVASGNCTAGQTMYWNSVSSTFACSTISISVAGDVTGNQSATKVVALQNNPVDSTAPTNNQVLQWNGSKWIPATLPAGNPGTVTSVSGTAPISVATSTSTPAISISQATTSTNGYLSSTDWNAFNNKQAAGNYVTALTGDVTATGPGSATATVAKLQGNTLTLTAPTSGQYLKYNGTAFVNSALSSSDLTGNIPASLMPAFSGDVTSSAGSTVLTLSAAGTAGTYYKVTTDSKGRVTSGAASLAVGDIPGLPWSQITSGKPTTLGGYGITDAVLNAGNAVSIQSGNDASKGAAATNGRFYFATDTQKIYFDNGTSWIQVASNSGTGGTVTSVATGTGLSGGPITSTGTISLANTSVTAASYGSTSQVPTFTVDAQGRLTAASNTSIAIPWSAITSGVPTTLAGYGITDSVKNLGGTPGVQTGTDASKPASPTAGTIYFATDSLKIYQYNTGAWAMIASAAGSGGTVTSVTSANADIGVATTTSTPVLTLNSGTSANQIVKLDGSAKLPAVDGSALTNLNASALTSGTVSTSVLPTIPLTKGGTGLTAAGAANQVLGMNNAGTAAEFKTITAGSGVSVTHGANSVTIATTGAPPTGAAGGDLSGTYPNPTLNTVTVAKGGTGLTSGTSGGIPYFDSNSTMASSAALTANGVLIGGGAGASPTATSAGAAYQPLRVPAGGGTPAFGAIDISQAAAVTGVLPIANGGTGASSLAANRLIGTNGTGTIQQAVTCAINEILSFDASGNYGCYAAASIFSGFLNGGNTFGATSNLGNNDNFDLNIKTNNLTRITVQAGGNVGIGTPSPGGALDIVDGQGRIVTGNVTVGAGPTLATAPTLTFSSTNNTAGPTSWNGNTRFTYDNNGFVISHNGSSGAQSAPPGFGLGTGGRNADIFIDGTANVGIGTTSPGAKLEIDGSSGSTLKIVDGNQALNKVLTSDANGVASWASLPAGNAGTVTSVATGTGLSGGTITSSGTISLANTAVTAAAYGSTTQVPTFTVDAQGRLTAAANVTISGVAPGGAAGGDLTGTYPNPTLNTVTVAKGGTGLTSGTSGGIPYFASSSTMASSAALTANGVLLGGGAGASPTATSAGAAYQPLRVPAGGGAPAFGAIDISQAAAVTGVLPITNGGTGASSLAANRLVGTNGSGTVQQAVTCAINQILSFDASGNYGCYAIGSIYSGFINGGNTFGATSNLGNNDNFDLNIKTNNLTRMTVQAGGNVGVGTSSPSDLLTVSQADGSAGVTVLNTSSTSSRTPGFTVKNYSGSASGNPTLLLQSARGTSAAATAISSGDNLGQILFQGLYNGSSYTAGAQIYAQASENWTSSTAGTNVIFNTVKTGSTSNSETMRIDANGRLGIGASSINNLLQVGPNGSQTNKYGVYVGSYLSSAGQAQYVGNWTGSGYWGIGPATNASDNTIRIGNTSDQLGTWSGTQNVNLVIGGALGVGTTTLAGQLANTSTNTGDSGTYAAPSGFGVTANSINWLGNGVGYVGQFVNAGSAAGSDGINIYTVASDSGSYVLNARSNGTSRFVVRADGYVGVGTASPTYNLHVSANSAAYVGITNENTAAGGMRWNWLSSSTAASLGANAMCFEAGGVCRMSLNSSGNMNIGGTLTQNSDRRLKKNIKVIPDALKSLSQLNGVTYNWINPERGTDLQIGLIAQDVEKVYPQAVKTDKQGLKSVAYQNLVGPIISAINEIRTWLQRIDTKIHSLEASHESRLNALETQMGALKQQNELLRQQNEQLIKALNSQNEKAQRIPASADK